MKKFVKLLPIIILLISTNIYAQKVSIKKNIAYIEDKEYLKIEGCTAFSSVCSFYNINGEEIIYISYKPRPDDPKLHYQIVKFLGLNKSIELGEPLKGVIKILYNNKAINEDGTFNIEKVDRLVEKYGNSFTDKINVNIN